MVYSVIMSAGQARTVITRFARFRNLAVLPQKIKVKEKIP
jgi:hypothetical protein